MSVPQLEPATSKLDLAATDVGSVFVSNYPPYGVWDESAVPKAIEALDSPGDPDVPLGLYLHIPWCRVRCPYCAFYVRPDREARHQAFVDAVLAEWSARAGEFGGPPATIYLGGGTPSRLPEAELRRLLDGLPRPTEGELTVEVNPEDASDSWLDAAEAAGVTRVSLRVQTFGTRYAHLLNRRHTV